MQIWSTININQSSLLYFCSPKPSKKEKYIVLELEKEYPDNLLPLSVLKEKGLGQVQIQARVDRRLLKYIETTEEMLSLKEKKAGGDIDA